ncbi:hypothetical protein JTB14_025001 [Gonioctena quinquepunctata]|nr:hypothetical protein JTB14_025001 [Gonioctena quinquepunctata]
MASSREWLEAFIAISTYKKEQKKVAGSKKSGAGTSEIYSPKLWYYPLLAFLNEPEEPRSSRSNIIDDNIPEEELIDETQPPPAADTGSETLPATETTSGATSNSLNIRDTTGHRLNIRIKVIVELCATFEFQSQTARKKECRYI